MPLPNVTNIGRPSCDERDSAHLANSPLGCKSIQGTSPAMLTISTESMAALQARDRRNLRSVLLNHWAEKLRLSGEVVGPTGREQVLREIEALARDDPSLDNADLMFAADLSLVDLANQVRAGRAGGRQ